MSAAVNSTFLSRGCAQYYTIAGTALSLFGAIDTIDRRGFCSREARTAFLSRGCVSALFCFWHRLI